KRAEQNHGARQDERRHRCLRHGPSRERRKTLSGSKQSLFPKSHDRFSGFVPTTPWSVKRKAAVGLTLLCTLASMTLSPGMKPQLSQRIQFSLAYVLVA